MGARWMEQGSGAPTPPVAQMSASHRLSVTRDGLDDAPGSCHPFVAGPTYDSDHPGRYSSSLVAGLAMLRCFTGERPVRGIADMSDEIGFVSRDRLRYTATLVQLRTYLEQTTSRKYRLSARGANVGLCLLKLMRGPQRLPASIYGTYATESVIP